MGLLSKASKTTSYQSWQDLEGNATALVQRRTSDGLSKNRSAGHRLAYSANDLFPFRIILLSGHTGGLRYNPESTGATKDHENDARMKDATKHIIAVGQSKSEIQKDWADICNFADAENLTPEAWQHTFKHIHYQKRNSYADGSDAGSAVTSRTSQSPDPKSPQQRREAFAAALFTGGGGGGSDEASQQQQSPGRSQQLQQRDSSVSGYRSDSAFRNERYEEARGDADGQEGALSPAGSPTSYGGSLSTTLATLEPESPASPAELWLMRVARLWDGSSPLAALVVAVLLVAATLARAGSWPLALGLPLFVGSLIPVDQHTAKTKQRQDRLARALRGHPIVRVLSQRQLAANVAASVVVLHFVAQVAIGAAPLAVAANWAGAVVAATIAASTARALRGESRGAWHARMDKADQHVRQASFDARTYFPSPTLPLVAQPPANDDVEEVAADGQPRGKAAAVAAAAMSGSVEDALEPCFRPLAVAELPGCAERALDLAFSSKYKWSKPSKAHNVEFATATVPWCSSPAARFKLSFPGARAMSIYRSLYDDPAGVKGRRSYAFQIEEMLADRYLIRRAGPNEAYWYTAFNSKFVGIAGRDFVNHVAPFSMLSEEVCAAFGMPKAPGFVYSAESYNGDGAPAANPPYVRAAMHRYGVIAQDTETGVDLICVVSIDPCGSIPKMAVPLVNRDTAHKLRNLESFVKNYERTHGAPDRLTLSSAAKSSKGKQQQKNDGKKDGAAASKGQANDTADKSNTTKKDDGSSSTTNTPDVVAKALELNASTGWTKRDGKEGCTWESLKVDYSDAEACRVTLFMPGVHAANFCEMLDDDPELKRGKEANVYKVDDLLLDRKFCGGPDKNDPRINTMVSFFKSPIFGIAARDFAQRRIGRYFLNDAEKKRFGIGHKGCDVFTCGSTFDPNVPDNKGYTRGKTHVFGMFAADRADDSGCDVTQVLVNEPGGKLPISLVNGLNKAQMDKMLKIMKLFQSIEKKDGRKKRETNNSDAEAEQQQQRDTDERAAEASSTSELPGAATVPLEAREGPLPEPFAKALKLWRNGDWKEKASRDSATQKVASSPWCPKDALWMHTKAIGARIEDFDVALNDNREPAVPRPDKAPFKYDRLLQNKAASDIDEKERVMILHNMFTSPSRLVAPRDTVVRLWWREVLSRTHMDEMQDVFTSSTGRVMAAAGVDASDRVPENKPFVRGATHVFSIWGVEQTDGLDIHIVMSFDPCGSVPTSLVNAANAEQLEKILLMRQLILAAAGERSNASSS